MRFPFSIRYKRRLKGMVTPDNQLQILSFIQNYIEKDKADNVVTGDLGVNYKGSTSNWNTNIFGAVDDGMFNLISENGTWFLHYQVNMRRLFIMTSIMAVAIGIIEQIQGDAWWFGIWAFVWLCGANWIIIFVRHGMEVDEIVHGVDELICGKPERVEIEKIPGKLKSWM